MSEPLCMLRKAESHWRGTLIWWTHRQLSGAVPTLQASNAAYIMCGQGRQVYKRLANDSDLPMKLLNHFTDTVLPCPTS